MGELHILIADNLKASAGSMMRGYLNYYGCGKIIADMARNGYVVHPLAAQVMHEDGIELPGYEVEAPRGLVYSLGIRINASPIPEDIRCNDVRQFRLKDPLSLSRYDDILTAYRELREVIKTNCIEIVGSFTLKTTVI